MSTILRLEGLDENAGTEDIRTFFRSLHIPDGGVYIVGGHLGEAFIAFATESDAQTGLLRTDNFLKDSIVTLHVSSMEEMEQKLEESLHKQETLINVKEPHPRVVVNDTSRPHKDGNVTAKCKYKSNDVSVVKGKPRSTPNDETTAKVMNKSTPSDGNTANGKPSSTPHDGIAVKVKPKSTHGQVKLRSTLYDGNTAKIKTSSRPHDGNTAKMKPSSIPHDGKTAVKPKSRLHDVHLATVKPKAKPHGDSISVSSSATFPLDPDPADEPVLIAGHFQQNPTYKPAVNVQPLDTSAAFLLGICTVLQGLKSTQTNVPTFEFPKEVGTLSFEAVRSSEHTSELRPGYVRLFGLPISTTKEDICRFFKGLHVQEAILNVELGIGLGCLVKFSDVKDASDALRFNQRMLGSVCVEVRGADEKLWERALVERSKAFDDWSKDKYGRSTKERTHSQRESVSALQIKRKSVYQVRFKPFKRTKPDAEPSVSSKTLEYPVMVRNLPRQITKTEIKGLFRCPNLPHKNVLHLLDKTRCLTDTAFVIFKCKVDFDYAINLSGCYVGSSPIEVTPVTRKIIKEIMAKNFHGNQKTGPTDPRLQSRLRRSNPVHAVRKNPNMTQRYIFIRNMPATVDKSQIRSLFCKFSLSLDDIMLLRDSQGHGMGEAVVKFESEQQATLAQELHCQEFLGTNVLLTLINGKQVQNILMNS